MMQLQRGEGPCLDCHATGVHIGVPDLSAEAEQAFEALRGYATGHGAHHADAQRRA